MVLQLQEISYQHTREPIVMFDLEKLVGTSTILRLRIKWNWEMISYRCSKNTKISKCLLLREELIQKLLWILSNLLSKEDNQMKEMQFWIMTKVIELFFRKIWWESAAELLWLTIKVICKFQLISQCQGVTSRMMMHFSYNMIFLMASCLKCKLQLCPNHYSTFI